MTKIAKRTDVASYRSMGTTPDGVVILAPKLAPTHFKAGEIRTTMARLRRNVATGQFEPEKRPRATGKRPK